MMTGSGCSGQCYGPCHHHWVGPSVSILQAAAVIVELSNHRHLGYTRPSGLVRQWPVGLMVVCRVLYGLLCMVWCGSLDME